MWKLKNRAYGFTIIEAMCSVAVFSIMFLTALSIKSAAYKMKIYNDITLKNIGYLESVKNKILSDLSDAELNEMVDSNKLYINNENINEGAFKNNSVSTLFSEVEKEEKPNIKIFVDKGYFQHIRIELYTKILGKNKILKCEFYKERT